MCTNELQDLRLWRICLCLVNVVWTNPIVRLITALILMLDSGLTQFIIINKFNKTMRQQHEGSHFPLHIQSPWHKTQLHHFHLTTEDIISFYFNFKLDKGSCWFVITWSSNWSNCNQYSVYWRNNEICGSSLIVLLPLHRDMYRIVICNIS